LERERHSCE
jgi:hypothetical protein